MVGRRLIPLTKAPETPRRRLVPLSKRPVASPAAPAPAVEETAAPAGKGRPTPKRREAQRARRQVAAPKTRKEAYRQAREQAKAERAKLREGLLRGDERALPARDRGPVRGYARDFIDSRRSVAEFFLYVALAMLLFTLVNVPVIQAAVTLLWSLVLVLIIVDSVVLTRRLRRQLAVRFPDEDRRGVVLYALMRSLQIRRLRLPPPRVRPGTPI